MAAKWTMGDFEPASERIEIPNGQSLAVQGLTLADVLIIASANAGEIDNLVRTLSSLGLQDNASEAECIAYVMTALQACPDLVGEIIARASGFPDFVRECSTLPCATQVAALEAIFRLTMAGRTAGEMADAFSTMFAMSSIATVSARSRGLPK